MGRGKSQQEQRLLELLNSPVNRNKCGECKENDPTWASWNLGVFLCGRCASAHRSLGQDISVVKSLSMENWSNHELSVLGKIGNKRNNSFWNEKHVPFPYDPDDKDSLVTWLRDKYTGKFRFGSVTDSDYNLDDSWGDRTDDYGFDYNSKNSRNTPRKKSSRLSSVLGLNYVGPNRRREQELANKSFFENDEEGHGYGYSGNSSREFRRSSNGDSNFTRSMRRGSDKNLSRNREASYDDDYDNYDNNHERRRNGSNSRYSSPISPNSTSRSMRLSFRRPTNSEYRKYGDQSRKMKFDMGYEDEDINIEALVLSHGNINRAIDIIKDSGVKPNVNNNDSNRNNNNNNNNSNNNNSNSTPSLPQRKETAGAIFDSSKVGGFNWLDDTTTAATANSNTVDNQIYQYVDPNTGAIYYIDANGQQYIDPNQQQQQPEMNAYQLQQAQQQQALQQQQILQQQTLQQQALQQQALQQQQMVTGFAQPAMTGIGTQQQREPTLNELAQQQQLQQQQLQQQQLQQQQLQQQFQQPNYFGGF